MEIILSRGVDLARSIFAVKNSRWRRTLERGTGSPLVVSYCLEKSFRLSQPKFLSSNIYTMMEHMTTLHLLARSPARAPMRVQE